MTNKTKQTAVEYIIEQLYAPCRGIPSHIIEKAKEMEEQQHKKTAEYWANHGKLSSTDDNYKGISFEQWYNETYGE
jgi:hypothetical protein